MASQVPVDDEADCQEVGQKLQAYLDGEVDDLDLRRIAAHLQRCLECGLEAAAYMQIKTALARRGEGVDQVALQRLRGFANDLAAGRFPPSPGSLQDPA